MKLRLLFLLIFTCLAGILLAQDPIIDSTVTPEEDNEEIVKPPMNEDSKLGIKLGGGVTSLVGKEPNNPRPAMYLTGGVYGRFKMKPKSTWLIQFEGDFSYKGSNFANNVGEYGSIKAYYIELPVMLLHGLDANNVNTLVGGLQYSRLLNAVIYKVNGNVPESGEFSINKNDLSLIGGAQFHTPFVGFQVLLKYGLLNANTGLAPALIPVNQGKSMHNLTFEVSLIF